MQTGDWIMVLLVVALLAGVSGWGLRGVWPGGVPLTSNPMYDAGWEQLDEQTGTPV